MGRMITVGMLYVKGRTPIFGAFGEGLLNRVIFLGKPLRFFMGGRRGG
ncbi:hypothetical protein Dd703_1260 [Musicola paradisiaca Ech703]|uniref:Uncharacterized protein n=1 Tax=Musicola paradisiaca (strain Ech703) TaxID=579405 RepID=C6CD21_MUSP7|nr:hypothetical protein Dd703_1260 [Musicola paradisiaca Ech703]